MNLESHVFGQLSDLEQLKKITDIKVRSILNSGPAVDAKSTFLNIGDNFIGDSLRTQGYSCADNPTGSQKYDYVIAADEWLTVADSEQQQRDKIAYLKGQCNRGFYTTLKDYKNMHHSQRSTYSPFTIKSDTGEMIVVRWRDWSETDRQSWTEKTYVIQNDQLTVLDDTVKRTMYFKQLAKFTADAGAKEFIIEKKNMYKSLFSKDFDYIIYVGF